MVMEWGRNAKLAPWSAIETYLRCDTGLSVTDSRDLKLSSSSSKAFRSSSSSSRGDSSNTLGVQSGVAYKRKHDRG